MNEEKAARRKQDDEADKWFYNLGRMAEAVETNLASSVAARKEAVEAQRKAKKAHKRTLVLTAFTLFAFLLLAWRSEVEGRHIHTNQVQTCQANRAIIAKFNAEQQELAKIERTNRFVDAPLRNARVKAYTDVLVIPLPICSR